MGLTYLDGAEEIRLCFRWIAPGSFKMGSPETEPERITEREKQHEVYITKGFWLAESTCTQALWEAVMGEGDKNPSRFKGKERPVDEVTWKDAHAFIKKINQQVEGLHLRLPTEAEWEFACRAGTKTPFSFGKNITPEQVNYRGDYPYAKAKTGLYRKETVDVKSLPPNPWGLYEMHGNVWEWCADRFQKKYEQDTKVDPRGPATGDARVRRGGCWDYDADHARSAYRYVFDPGYRDDDLGFRPAQGIS